MISLGGLKMTVRELMTLDEARSRYVKSLAISLSEHQITQVSLNNLKHYLSQ